MKSSILELSNDIVNKVYEDKRYFDKFSEEFSNFIDDANDFSTEQKQEYF